MISLYVLLGKNVQVCRLQWKLKMQWYVTIYINIFDHHYLSKERKVAHVGYMKSEFDCFDLFIGPNHKRNLI